MSVVDIPEATAVEAFSALKDAKNAILVDVRTRAEWSFVGLPDLSEIGAEPILTEWQTFPTMAINADFGEALERAVPDKTTAVYFLCRSGVRSLAAAREMSARGYKHVFNVADGFEGPADDQGHRSNISGWRAAGLPWRQS
ncbi:MAG: rhodanese-like domain-containing protein [Pseudomonadota bacterium]